ncbi:MAG: TonB-dependent receptor, partial [Candidatus Cloacimonadota bacterium]|nr:TonB-dependent receptor [Candidatus Cloacimonadota bacterium]
RYNNYFKKLPGPIQNLSLYKNSRTKGENIYNKLKISTPKYHSQLNLFIAKDFNIYDNSRLEPPFDTNFMYSKFAKNLQSQRGIYYRSTLAINDFESDFGADYKYEDFSYKEYKPFDDSLEFVPQNSISHIYHENYSAFFKLNYKKDFQQFNIEIQNGIRKDFPINFQNFLSWNISPKIDYYSYIGNFQVGSVFGNSFTLPSFYNLYWKGDSQTIGNPNLKPEESFSQEYFINLSEYSHKLSFSYQHQYLQDMIIWAQDFNKRWKPLNISEVKIQNYQTDLALSFFDFWDFSANYIRTISEDLTKNDDGEPTSFYGNELIYTPRYNLSVENQFKIKEVNIKFQYKKTGHQWSTRDQLSEDKKIAEYEIINVSLNYTKKFRKIELVTGIDLNNIQNNMYEIYKYIPQPGFNMNFKIKIKVRN